MPGVKRSRMEAELNPDSVSEAKSLLQQATERNEQLEKQNEDWMKLVKKKGLLFSLPRYLQNVALNRPDRAMMLTSALRQRIKLRRETIDMEFDNDNECDVRWRSNHTEEYMWPEYFNNANEDCEYFNEFWAMFPEFERLVYLHGAGDERLSFLTKFIDEYLENKDIGWNKFSKDLDDYLEEALKLHYLKDSMAHYGDAQDKERVKSWFRKPSEKYCRSCFEHTLTYLKNPKRFDWRKFGKDIESQEKATKDDMNTGYFSLPELSDEEEREGEDEEEQEDNEEEEAEEEEEDID